MAYFGQTLLIIYEETMDAKICGVSANGTPKKCLVKISTTVGDLQPLSVNNAAKDYGETPQGKWVVYLDINAPVTPQSILEDPDGVQYMANGKPMKRGALLPHIKLNLLEMG